MSRQLNLRVSDEFAEKLERVARRVGRPMAAVLEAVGTSALDAAEADALAAWEEYQLSGASVSAKEIAALLAETLGRAEAAAKNRSR